MEVGGPLKLLQGLPEQCSVGLSGVIFGLIILMCIVGAPYLRTCARKLNADLDRRIEDEKRKDRLARVHPDLGKEKQKKEKQKKDKDKAKGSPNGGTCDDEADDSKNKLLVGDPVQCCRLAPQHGLHLFDASESFPATVTKDNKDGTFAVAYVGGETHPAVPRAYITKASEAYTFS